MTEKGDGPDSPEAAFGLVANEVRFEILQALWDAGQEESVTVPLQFSELFDRVDVRDSGQFNYHLDKLVPRFVRDAEDGYELTYAGEKVIGAAVSGVYTDTDVTVETIDVGECMNCGGTMQARYEAGRLEVECADCDVVVTDGLPAPPVLAANHDPEELPQVFSRLLVTRIRSMAQGFCPLCGGAVEPSVDPDGSSDDGDDDAGEQPFLGVEQRCQECGREVQMNVGAVAFDHPAVVRFLDEKGIDVRGKPVWEHEWLYDADETVISEDPLRIELAVELAGDRLVLTLDEDLSVIDRRRE